MFKFLMIIIVALLELTKALDSPGVATQRPPVGDKVVYPLEDYQYIDILLRLLNSLETKRAAKGGCFNLFIQLDKADSSSDLEGRRPKLSKNDL
ncbi:GD14992 [Drosophila simulans]|uniref:GD14992 n=1 Tax=Drosophila simulans TaxID=7240 RepID=B4QKM1_DROSI|nr:GD14992 [Drosophila simulans]